MKVACKWEEKLRLSATADGHTVAMDTKAPLGSDSAMTPKQLVLAGLCGCTAMDVLSLLKKHKEPIESFEMEADATSTSGGHPTVFSRVDMKFLIKGQVSAEKAVEAVRLSQTKYCGVSAMLARAVPIHYSVFINGAEVGSGQAAFQNNA
jgi:putative redox protein